MAAESAGTSSIVATAMADAATGPLAVPRAALAPDLLLDTSKQKKPLPAKRLGKRLMSCNA